LRVLQLLEVQYGILFALFFCLKCSIFVNLIFFQIWLFLFAKSTLRQNATFTQLCNFFLLPEASGRACVNFGCTHPIDGLFWSLSIYYFLGFFSKYECWVNNLIMPLYQIFFFGDTNELPFCITRFHITMKCKKQFIWLVIKMIFFL
jgi:hypothetical protein